MKISNKAKLTNTHLRILRTIAQYLELGKTPSISDLVSDLALAGDTSLTPTLKIMQRNGFIEMHGGGKRGCRWLITLSLYGKTAIGVGCLPVLGAIPAGPLSEVIQQHETVIEDNKILPYKPGDFLLVVQGESMIGDGILPGDKVLLRPGVLAQNGEIAAVRVGEEYLATLKRIYFELWQNKVVLKASNPIYKDIVVETKDVQIVGVFRGLVRNST